MEALEWKFRCRNPYSKIYLKMNISFHKSFLCFQVYTCVLCDTKMLMVMSIIWLCRWPSFIFALNLKCQVYFIYSLAYLFTWSCLYVHLVFCGRVDDYLRIRPLSKSRLSIPICHLESLPLIGSFLEFDIQVFENEFLNGYREGDHVLYVSIVNDSGNMLCITEGKLSSWDPIWQQVNDIFEHSFLDMRSWRFLKIKYFGCGRVIIELQYGEMTLSSLEQSVYFNVTRFNIICKIHNIDEES